jgi:transcriptional regulator with XRE-family HTH domain
MTTGIKIRHLREKKRLSQEELAHLVGVSQVTIGNWEQGKSIKHEYIKKLADALEIQMEYLLQEEKSNSVAAYNSAINVSDKGFEIIIKAPNNFFEDLNRKMDFIITKFDGRK